MDTDEIEFEDGELDSAEESSEEDVMYIPLARPVAPPGSLLSGSSCKQNDLSSRRRVSSEEDSSDSETPSKRSFSLLKDPESGNSSCGGGVLFNTLARQFQEKRKKKNNVWGSILQEESLTSDLSSIGVSKAAKPAGFLDRGAESYDFSLASECSKLNRELDDYFKHKDQPPTQRRKRSIRDRLGSKKDFSSSSTSGVLDNMSIPPPGVPRIIPDLSSGLIEKGSLSDIAEELAAKLCEPKTELISGVLEIIGIPHTLRLFEETQTIEKNGGKMIKNGSRRRTPGGLFLQLLRESKEEDIDQAAVKKLFNVSSKGALPDLKAERAQKKNFEVELTEFRKLSHDLRKAQKAEEPEVEVSHRTPEPFVEPEAPPNSVERPGLAIEGDEEDELNCDSLDIDLS